MSTIELGDLSRVRDEPPGRGRPGRRTWRVAAVVAATGLLLSATGAAPVDQAAVGAYLLPGARLDGGTAGWGEIVAYVDGARRTLVAADLVHNRTLWTHDTSTQAWVERVGDFLILGERTADGKEGSFLTVLDPRTGEVRWRERLVSFNPSPRGDRLLARAVVDDGTWRIDDRDLATGRSSWSVRFPAGSHVYYPEEGIAGREFLIVPPDRDALAVDYATGVATRVGRVPEGDALSLYGDQLAVLRSGRPGPQFSMYALHDLAAGPLWTVSYHGGSGRPSPCPGGLLCYGEQAVPVRLDPRTGEVVDHLEPPGELVLTAAARSWRWVYKGPYANDGRSFVVSTLAPRGPGGRAWLGLARVDGASVTFTALTALPAEIDGCETTEAWLICSLAPDSTGLVAYRRAELDALAR